MGRSASEIEESMRNTLAEINPSIDFKVGPTYDYLLRPVPQELAFVEAQVDRLLRFYSGDFPVVASPTEARDFANNFGVSISLGERARGTVTFFRASPPTAGSTLTVPVGALVSTADATLIFRAVESVSMLGDFSDTYYNPTSNRYEITVPVQAVGPGTLYNVPPLRVGKILTAQLAFDGIQQNTRMSGGSEPESSFDLVNRVITQFKGINLGSIEGIAGMAKRFIPTGILDLKVIRPTDRLEFRRPTSGPALDLCLNGYDIQVFNEDYFAFGGETLITLKETSVTNVSGVSINGTSLDEDDWAFLPDTTPEYRDSTRAKNKIEFLSPLNPNDIVDIVGTKNTLLDRVQVLFVNNDLALFQTDVLVRAFVDLPIVVGVELRVKNSPNFNSTDTQNLLATIVADYIEPFEVPEELRADLLVENLRTQIPDLDSVRVFEFRRRYSSIEQVEVIRPLKNEIPKYDTTISTLTVRA